MVESVWNVLGNEDTQDVFHFLLSVIILLGAGYLAFSGRADSMPDVAIGAVLAFWFTRGTTQTVGGIVEKAVRTGHDANAVNTPMDGAAIPGPAGPTGPTGATGPTGPRGASGA